VVRWAVRLFRREWRQQLLVLGLLTVAVAATIWGTGNGTLPGIPAATFVFPSASRTGPPPATVVLVVEVLGLVSVAGLRAIQREVPQAIGDAVLPEARVP
jgi:hypothetical protein